jgi:transcriptional regulator with PAS, ATPase and Fis domain
MMSIKPSLTTISYNKKASEEINHQLNHILGDQINITSYYHDQIRPHIKIKDDLVLITTPILEPIIVPRLEDDCKYIVAHRNIDFAKINQLLDIPQGEDVLVVNNIFENAVEAVKELETVGLTSYHFIPYNPDVPLLRKYGYAVTLNEVELVPQDIPCVIDLGSRLVSLVTITEILYILTGTSNCDNLVISRYLSGLVNLSLEISKHSKQIESLQTHLHMLMMNFDDGIILADENMTISFHNDIVKKIMGREDLVGTNLRELIPRIGPQEYLSSGFCQISDKTLHYSIKAFSEVKDHSFYAITIKDLTDIQTIDEQYRKQVKYSGYSAKYTFSNILHRSSSISNLIKKAQGLALTDSTILITGESGTGKELFAQSMHSVSSRKNSPFVAINCAALTESLMESEFFGYEEGAFTGARKGGKRGFFEMAHTGTIFLDEIGDTSLSMQTKLLRVLQEKEIMRIGGSKIIPVDVRVIAATNQDLPALVRKGLFRLDLFYRLNVLPLHIPPLRDRPEDIKILMNFYLAKYALSQNKSKPQLTPAIYRLFEKHPWYGNIRELENISEYIVSICTSSANLYDDVFDVLKYFSRKELMESNEQIEKCLADADFSSSKMSRDFYVILQCLSEIGAEKTYAGKTLLQNHLEKQGIRLTYQQIRTRLQFLKNAGYINIFAGKGTLLTQKGIDKLRSGN